MSTYNRDNFYYAEYDNAVALYDAGEISLADNECRSLISAFECPRAIQAQAYQLRSFCVEDNYWLARSQLTQCLEVIAQQEQTPLAINFRDDTTDMRQDLDNAWRTECESRGMEPPQEQDPADFQIGVEDVADEGDADEQVDDMGDVQQNVEEAQDKEGVDGDIDGVKNIAGGAPRGTARASSPFVDPPK